MKVLIVNAGSSSLKYQLVDMDNEQMIVKGQVERIAIEGSHLNQKTPDMSKVIDLYEPIPDHVVATKLMLRALLDPEKGVLKSVDEIGAVSHRVLHGGEEFTASCIITDEVKAAIRKFIPAGPAAQSGEPDGHRGVRGSYAAHAAGGRVRHRVPSDHAPEGVHVWRSVPLL